VCWSVLECVAVYCSALQCVAVCCSALQCVAVCSSGMQCDAVQCSVFVYGGVYVHTRYFVIVICRQL